VQVRCLHVFYKQAVNLQDYINAEMSTTGVARESGRAAVESVRDSGVIVSRDLSPSLHTSNIVGICG